MTRAGTFAILGALIFLGSCVSSQTFTEITLRVYLLPVFDEAEIDAAPAYENARTVVNWMRVGFFLESFAGIALLLAALNLRRDPHATRFAVVAVWSLIAIPALAIALMDLGSHHMAFVAPRPLAALRWLNAFHEAAFAILGIASAACGALLSAL